MPTFRLLAPPLLALPLLALPLLALFATTAQAQGWGAPGRDAPGREWGPPRHDWGGPRSGNDPREGKIEVTRFLAPGAAAALGHGGIAVAAAADDGMANEHEQAAFTAAVADRLAHAGYQGAGAAPTPAASQRAQIRVTHAEVAPGDPPHKPVSGEMEAGIGNRGSSFGLGLSIDLSKPRGPLVSTMLEARIADAATGAVLWEGRAEIVTREGGHRWSTPALADRLSGALFAHFPGKSDEHYSDR